MLILLCKSLPNNAWAADSFGTPLITVADLILGPVPIAGKQIGVFAVVLCLDQRHCVIADQSNPKLTVGIDTRQMRPEDRRRLVLQCFYAPCSEILVGTIKRRTFAATASYDTKLPVSLPKSGKVPIWAGISKEGNLTSMIKRPFESSINLAIFRLHTMVIVRLYAFL
jgi:hypothetical protein